MMTGNNLTQQVIVTLTGANDLPMVGVETLTGAVTANAHAPAETTSGTIAFHDVDLTDTHIVSAAFKSTDYSSQLGTLSAVISNDTTGSGAGGLITWTFTANDSALAPLAANQTVHEIYTVTLDDHHGGVITQDVTVTVTGTEDAPDITVGAGDSAAVLLAKTNAALSTTGTLTVTDLDLSDSVTPTVDSVSLSGTTGGLTSAAVLGMLSVSPASIAANPGDANNLNWSFNSGSQVFNFLAVGESLTLTYTVKADDGHGGFDNQTVTVTVTGTQDDAPDITVGAGDSAARTLVETNAALSTAGTLTVTDVNLSDSVTPTVASVSLSGTTGGLTSAAVLGMLSVSPASIAANPGDANNLNWSFNSTPQAFNFLAAGESLTLTYTVKADDGHGGFDNQTVTVTVTGTEDAPDITVGAGDSAAVLLAKTNAALSTTGTLTVTDLDLSDSVTPTVDSVSLSGTTGGLTSAAVLGMLSVSPASIAANPGDANNLNWSFNSGSQVFNFLAVGESLTLTYTVKADDGHGGFDNQTVTVTVTGTQDDAPDITVGAGDSAARTLVETNAALSTAGTLTVTDVNLSDSVTPTVASVSLSGTTGGLTSAAVLGMLSVSPASIAANPGDANNLNWSFNSTPQAFNFLAAGELLTLTYTVKADDGHGGFDNQTVIITITGTNDAPVLDASKTPILNAELQGVGAPVNGTVVGTLVSSLVDLNPPLGGLDNVTDPDNAAFGGIALTGTDTSHGIWFYTIDGGAHWTAVGSVSPTSALLLAADPNTRLYFQPNAGYSGTDANAITFEAWDQTSGSNGATGVIASINGGSTAFSTATDTASITIISNDTTPPVFSDIITVPGEPGLWAFTGNKSNAGPGTIWTFQAAVTDNDAPFVGQGGIKQFVLSDNGAAIGSATFDGSTWTVSGLFSSVSYASGVYTILTSSTTVIKNGDTLKITAYDAANLTASKSVTLTQNSTFQVAPAGIAGDPINLALTDPSGGQATGPITLTVTGVPSDWSLNQGTNNGNGSWTVETNDLSALTVTTASTYAGAMVLGVTETWTNADGSTGTAVLSDNVEAYAPGAPIFAISGNDTLTGAGGNDFFVFAQPIGMDAIHNFNTATDKIDLMGFAGIASFGDLAIAAASNGDAVITLGAGETITLHGVDADSLTAANFVFDQTPVTNNSGSMVLSDGALLPLGGTINNAGAITLNSTGHETDLQIIGNGITLQGGGQAHIVGQPPERHRRRYSGHTLTNVDNTISGAGQIGDRRQYFDAGKRGNNHCRPEPML